MGFRMKSVDEIFTSLLTWITNGTDKLSDFNEGSAVRTLLESFSLQLEEFYFDLQQAVRYAIENAIYDAFGFEKYKANKATGYVSIKFREVLPMRLVVAKGSILTTAANSGSVLKFVVTEDTAAEIGAAQMRVPVECTTVGYTGNVDSYTIVSISPGSPYFEKVYNEESFYDGRDPESNTQRKLRFKQYIRSLQRGTREAIAYGAMTVSGVSGVYVDDKYIGFVRVYVHDINGNLSETLKQAVMEELVNWRAAGIEVEVLPIVSRRMDLDLTIIMLNDADPGVYKTNLEKLVRNFLNSFDVAENLYMSNLIATVMEGYRDVIVDIQINSGSDTYLLPNELIRAGTVNVEAILLKDWSV